MNSSGKGRHEVERLYLKVLTKRHLITHGLTPEQYKEKYGYKKGTSLVAKSLARSRRKTMQDMKLWEKRKKAPNAE